MFSHVFVRPDFDPHFHNDSVTVIKHWLKPTWGGEGLSYRAGTETETWRGLARRLALFGLVQLLIHLRTICPLCAGPSYISYQFRKHPPDMPAGHPMEAGSQFGSHVPECAELTTEAITEVNMCLTLAVWQYRVRREPMRWCTWAKVLAVERDDQVQI